MAMNAKQYYFYFSSFSFTGLSFICCRKKSDRLLK